MITSVLSQKYRLGLTLVSQSIKLIHHIHKIRGKNHVMRKVFNKILQQIIMGKNRSEEI